MKSIVKVLRLMSVMLVPVVIVACGGGGSGGSSGSGEMLAVGGSGTPTTIPPTGSPTSPETPAANGIFSVSIAITPDRPACGLDKINITVNQVRVHKSADADADDAGWTDITLNPSQKIDLLSLTNGAIAELGQVPLAVGQYTQMRLMLDPNTEGWLANSVVPSDMPVEVSLDTPSAVQSGIKLINEFDVVLGQRLDLVLDFDACGSIIRKGKGKYALKPVVQVSPIW